MKWTDIEDIKTGIVFNVKGADKIIQRSAKKSVKKLKSYDKIFKRHRKTKNYSKGWKVQMQPNKPTLAEGYVWNKTNWQLTWLLENGHFIVNKKGGVGWASAHAHIKPTYEETSKEYQKAMLKELNIEIEIE